MSASDHTAERRDNGDIDERERLGAKKIRATTLAVLFGAWLVTLLASMIAVGLAAGAAFILAIGLTVVGYIVGLLFSVPRALALAGEAAADGDKKPERIFSINTNLEQVSDWLTKIIVGVGLVEAQNIAKFVWQGARTIGNGFHDVAKEPVTLANTIALGIIVAFPCLGFLIGFYSVRLYVSRAMKETDSQVLQPTRGVFSDDAKQQVAAASEQIAMPYRGETEKSESQTPPPAYDPGTRKAVNAVLKRPLDTLTEEDLIARGQALMAQDDYAQAVATFEECVKRFGPEPKIVVEYARALMRLTPTNWALIVQVLEDARRRFNPLVPLDLRRRITQYLLNAYLYRDPPNSFQAAIRVGDEFVSSESGTDDPFAYVYLAAAHGQAYTYWKGGEQLDRARAEVPLVRNAIVKALATPEKIRVRKRVLSWLRSLAATGADDDLYQVVKDNPDLANLLEPPPEQPLKQPPGQPSEQPLEQPKEQPPKATS